MLFLYFFHLSLVFVGFIQEVWKVGVDSWNLLGLVGGFLHFYSLRTCREGFVWQPGNGLEISLMLFGYPPSCDQKNIADFYITLSTASDKLPFKAESLLLCLLWGLYFFVEVPWLIFSCFKIIEQIFNFAAQSCYQLMHYVLNCVIFLQIYFMNRNIEIK